MSNDSYTYMDDQTLKTLLAQHQQNLGILNQQGVQFGAAVPLSIVNQIKSSVQSIKTIETILGSHNTVIPDRQAVQEVKKEAQVIIERYYAGNDNSQNISASDGGSVNKATQTHEGSGSGSQNITAKGGAISDVEQVRRDGPYHCSTCNEIVPLGQKFCGNCGTKVA